MPGGRCLIHLKAPSAEFARLTIDVLRESQMSNATQSSSKDLRGFHSEPLARDSKAQGYDIYLVGVMVAAVFAVAIVQLVLQLQ